MLHIMKLQVFGLLLCITISVNGKDDCTFNGPRCFVGGYQHFPNVGYYKLYTMKSTWNDAWKQCKDDGGHLVVINSQKEYDIVRKMQKASGEHVLHVGMHDLFKEGVFLTLTGEDFISSEYLKWDVNQPTNHGGNENCVDLRTNGLLNDVPCSDPQYFVCEHNPMHHTQ